MTGHSTGVARHQVMLWSGSVCSVMRKDASRPRTCYQHPHKRARRDTRRARPVQTRRACTWRTGCRTCWARSWRARCTRAARCMPSGRRRPRSWPPAAPPRAQRGAPAGPTCPGPLQAPRLPGGHGVRVRGHGGWRSAYALVLAGRRSALGAQARGSGPARAARSGKLSDSAASAASCHYCDQKLYSWRLAAKLHYAALVRNLMASSERRTLVACRAWRTVLGAA